MKFRFCGDADCPDWVLSEINVLSKMSSVRMMLICRQIRNQLLGTGINYEKLNKLTTGKRLNFEPSEIKAMIAALHFILRNSAKYDVDGVEVLPMELEQLGLPADVARAICKTYVKCKSDLRARLLTQTLHMPRVVEADWRVDYVLASSSLKNVATPTVRMNLQLSKAGQNSLSKNKDSEVSFEMSSDKFAVLYADLKAARAAMAQVS